MARHSTIDEAASDTLRLDIWLYRTRLFKTRSLATKTITRGRVRLTRDGRTERIRKAHFQVRPGDEIALMRAGDLCNLAILSLPDRRGPFDEASACYTDHHDCATDGTSTAPVD